MTNRAPLSYSAALSASLPPPPPNQPPQQPQQQTRAPAPSSTQPTPPHRPRSPRHTPQASHNEPVYVLTLTTNAPHHARMTALRTKYFPKHLNKLDAHLTLFHALPHSHLASHIVPVLEEVASATAPFPVLATKPFRLKKGVAISIAKTQGVQQAENVHKRLQEPWLASGASVAASEASVAASEASVAASEASVATKAEGEGGGRGLLSEQDASPNCRIHYTIMNKVDSEADVLAALEEVRRSFQPDESQVTGLGLWLYERGFWKWERGFEFTG